MRVVKFREPPALIVGLADLRRQGLTPRGLLFVAIDGRGEIHLAIPENLDLVRDIKVGDKLSIEPPWPPGLFHFDAIHRLPGDSVLWNGDRRLGETGTAQEVACAIADWLKGSSAKNVFLGCAPHQPGSWWSANSMTPVIELHARGVVDCVVTASGLVARQIGEPHLMHLDFATLRREDGPKSGWTKVFESGLGNILLVERRVQNYRLALTCEYGVVEVDVSPLPDTLQEVARVPLDSGFGIVGRVDGGAFAVTFGRVEPWGLADLRPAMLVGSPNESILDLPRTLRAIESAHEQLG